MFNMVDMFVANIFHPTAGSCIYEFCGNKRNWNKGIRGMDSISCYHLNRGRSVESISGVRLFGFRLFHMNIKKPVCYLKPLVVMSSACRRAFIALAPSNIIHFKLVLSSFWHLWKATATCDELVYPFSPPEHHF